MLRRVCIFLFVISSLSTPIIAGKGSQHPKHSQRRMNILVKPYLLIRHITFGSFSQVIKIEETVEEKRKRLLEELANLDVL